MKILNISKNTHLPSLNSTFFNLEGTSLSKLNGLLTFDTVPSDIALDQRAFEIAALAREELDKLGDDDAYNVLVDVPSFLVRRLVEELKNEGISVAYPFFNESKYLGFIWD